MKHRKVHDTRVEASIAGAANLEPLVAIELMPLAELCNRLAMMQRPFLCRELACLYRLIGKVVKQDTTKNPQLLKLQKTFMAFRQGFTSHLREEAGMTFPLIRGLESGTAEKTDARRLIKISTERMEIQHFKADEDLAKLRALTENYVTSLPTSSCVRQWRDKLAGFERNLHEQMYEENRVLFPRALAISRA
jgi:regulator of cell morphogenesis and NO signaling